MRKWFVIVMAAFGMTLFMLLGLGDVTRVEAPDPFGTMAAPDPGATDVTAASPIALHAVVSLDARAYEGLQRAAERYAAMRPDVSVTLRNVDSDELRNEVRDSTETGDAPDIMLYPTEWVRREAAEGLLLSLDDYISPERQSLWFDTVRGAVRWNGYLWGVPADWDPYVFVFRRDDPLGEALAEAPPTVSTWLELGGKAKSGTPGSTYGEALLRHWSAVEAVGEVVNEAPEQAEAHVAAAGTDADAVGGTSARGGAPTTVEEAGQGSAAPALGEVGAEAAATQGTAGAVSRGEAAWAFVPLSQAIEAAASAEPDAKLSVAAFVPDEEAAGGLPPFAGRSFVVSPATEFPAEAAEWIRYITDPSVVDEFGTTGGGRWPVTRASFGLPSSFAAGTPTVLGTTAPAAVAPLPDASGLDERETLNALRPLLRMVDSVRASYGPPPVELPPPGDVP